MIGPLSGRGCDTAHTYTHPHPKELWNKNPGFHYTFTTWTHSASQRKSQMWQNIKQFKCYNMTNSTLHGEQANEGRQQDDQHLLRVPPPYASLRTVHHQAAVRHWLRSHLLSGGNPGTLTMVLRSRLYTVTDLRWCCDYYVNNSAWKCSFKPAWT